LLITSIIFSKDRPAQLDLCLNSIKANFPESTENIVIHKNSKDFSDAHNILRKEHPDVQFWSQGASLFRDIFTAIYGSPNDYICFFTDDDICFSEISLLPNLEKIFTTTPISCISLRMGLNICKRSHGGQMSLDTLKHYQSFNDMIIWPKTTHMYGSYWSYSLSVDGHIYRKSQLANMMDELCYLDSKYDWKQTPNELESSMQRFWPLSENLMAAPTHSKVVNSPNNRVQHEAKNMSGEKYSVHQDWLLKQYLAGKRIALEQLSFDNIDCPHTEINLTEGMHVR